MADPWAVVSQKPAPSSPYETDAAFKTRMDKTYGPGKWKDTSDYRTPGHNRAVGGVAGSNHTRGDPNAPGAHDIVVPGMDSKAASSKLPVGLSGYPESDHLHVNEKDPWAVVSQAPAVAAAPGKTPPTPKQAAPPPKGDTSYFSILKRRESENMDAMRRASKVAEGNPLFGAVMHPLTALGGMGGAMGLATAPIEAGFEAAGNYEAQHPKSVPARIDRAFGLGSNISPKEARALGDVAGMAVPMLGDAKGALKAGSEAGKISRELSGVNRSAKAAETAVTAKEAAKHAADVEHLKGYGFDPTPGMAKGKDARLAEIGKERQSFGQKFYIKQAGKAEDSFQRAKYNYDLEPLKGLKSVKLLKGGYLYPSTKEVGTKGVDRVAKTIGYAFDKVLPNVKMRTDPELYRDLARLDTQTEDLRNSESGKVFRAIDTAIRGQLGKPGEAFDLTGRQFKQMESELNKDKSAFYKKGDWREAEIVEGYLEALRNNMVRHSPAPVAADVSRINQAYARLSKTKSAAARNPTSLGRFDTEDLLHVTKAQDTSGGDRFARGLAPGQDFASRAHAVMHPTPVTRDAAELAHVPATKHGLITAGARKVASPIANKTLEVMSDRGRRLAREKAYLEGTGQTGKRGKNLRRAALSPAAAAALAAKDGEAR